MYDIVRCSECNSIVYSRRNLYNDDYLNDCVQPDYDNKVYVDELDEYMCPDCFAAYKLRKEDDEDDF